jgi:hypothetical protein
MTSCSRTAVSLMTGSAKSSVPVSTNGARQLGGIDECNISAWIGPSHCGGDRRAIARRVEHVRRDHTTIARDRAKPATLVVLIRDACRKRARRCDQRKQRRNQGLLRGERNPPPPYRSEHHVAFLTTAAALGDESGLVSGGGEGPRARDEQACRATSLWFVRSTCTHSPNSQAGLRSFSALRPLSVHEAMARASSYRALLIHCRAGLHYEAPDEVKRVIRRRAHSRAEDPERAALTSLKNCRAGE